MTRKHFIAMARIIKTELDISDTLAERQAVKGVATQMCDYFASQNPNFDRKRFLTACGF